GTREKPVSEEKDVQLVGQVEGAEEELTEGWRYAQQHKNADKHALRRHLESTHKSDVADVLTRRHRTLRGTAIALVADRTKLPIESVSARVSNGRTLRNSRT